MPLTEEPPRSSNRPPKRRRKSNGQFEGEQPPTEQYLNALAKRKNRNARNCALGNRFFDTLLDVVFLNGADQDFIPGDTGIGPLVSLVEKLFKAIYLPTRSERSLRVRCRYFGFVTGKQQSDLPWLTIRDANNPNGKGAPRRVFKGRRFPKLSRQATEIRDLWRWIHAAGESAILAVGTAEQVYEVFRQTFLTYQAVDGRYLYAGYPPQRNARSRTPSRPLGPASGSGSGEHAPLSVFVPGAQGAVPREREAERQSNLVVNGDEIQESRGGGNTSTEDASRSSSQAQRAQGDGADSHTAHPPEPIAVANPPVQPSNQDRSVASYISRAIETARDDRLFYLLCTVVDDGSTCKLDCVASALLEKGKNGELRLSTLMQDVLQYAKSKHFGITDVRDHRVRRERIVSNVELLKKARLCFGLSSYDYMKWEDFNRGRTG